jgi:hypothetical protein
MFIFFILINRRIICYLKILLNLLAILTVILKPFKHLIFESLSGQVLLRMSALKLLTEGLQLKRSGIRFILMESSVSLRKRV